MSRRFLSRSDNLRPAPRWITPELVGRILNLAMPVGANSTPIVQVPTRGVKPKLAIIPNAHPPITHSRRSEEREAAAIGPTPAASPPRKITNPTGVAAPVDTPAPAAEHGPALHPAERGRLAHNEILHARAAAQIEADRPLFQIAFERGIAIIDLAHVLGQNQCTVALHTRIAGMRFGRRMPLADPLTREQLLALADPAVPLPELRCARLKRQRREKWNAYAKSKRSADVERRRAANPPKQQRPRQPSSREVQKAAVCRPVRPAPSREPAAPPPPAPRAQPIVVRQTPGAPRYVNYAESMNAAVAYLRSRQFVVQRHSREEIIARWHVSGWSGLFSNQQLIDLAIHHGLELRA